jgi:hypothetical protein
MVYSGAWGKLIHEKNQKQKISWHCPFNAQLFLTLEYHIALSLCACSSLSFFFNRKNTIIIVSIPYSKSTTIYRSRPLQIWSGSFMNPDPDPGKSQYKKNARRVLPSCRRSHQPSKENTVNSLSKYDTSFSILAAKLAFVYRDLILIRIRSTILVYSCDCSFYIFV